MRHPGRRLNTRLRPRCSAQNRRRNPDGIETPVKKVVGSIAQVGDQGEKKRLETSCALGEVRHPARDLPVRVESVVEPLELVHRFGPRKMRVTRLGMAQRVAPPVLRNVPPLKAVTLQKLQFNGQPRMV